MKLVFVRLTLKSVSISTSNGLYAVCICVVVIAEQKQKINRTGINQADVQPVGKSLCHLPSVLSLHCCYCKNTVNIHVTPHMTRDL